MVWQAFLQIPNVSGESTDSRRKGWIDLTGVSFGANVSAANARPEFEAVVVTKAFDSTSFVLLEHILSGTPIDGGLIEIVAGVSTVEATIYRVTLKQGHIAAASSHVEANQALETIQIACTQMQWTVTDQSGKVVAPETGWDIVNNKVM